MINQIYFADEELREVEKAIYDITLSQGNQRLDRAFLLEKLFERGFTFEKYTSNKIKRFILGYLRNWAQQELSTLQVKDTETNQKTKLRIENIQLLIEMLKLAAKDLNLLNTSMSLASKIIKENKIKNFMRAMYEAIYCRNLKDLERRRQLDEFFNRARQNRESGDGLSSFLQRREETTEQISYEPTVKEEKEEEIDEAYEEFKKSPYGKFFKLVYAYINELEEFPKEELKSLFEEEGINLEDITVSQLIRTLFDIAEFKIENMINEDEYISEKFYSSDFEDIGADCKDLEDLESKDCQLARLYYLWLLIEEGSPYGDYELFKFLEDKIKFTNAEKNLIEFIKEQIDTRKQREKERIAQIRKQRAAKKKKKKN
ncbi:MULTISPECIES: hypothetical protein [Thermodesulfovibrio]|uniref:hypothetical protein n=1 Tax=Thermodesulfovibrio yellowstonii TaxID=28262 RepID=UPI00040455CE|nr:hypothetical protein [Thermodesulfovibrio islandicus]